MTGASRLLMINGPMRTRDQTRFQCPPYKEERSSTRPSFQFFPSHHQVLPCAPPLYLNTPFIQALAARLNASIVSKTVLAMPSLTRLAVYAVAMIAITGFSPAAICTVASPLPDSVSRMTPAQPSQNRRMDQLLSRIRRTRQNDSSVDPPSVNPALAAADGPYTRAADPYQSLKAYSVKSSQRSKNLSKLPSLLSKYLDTPVLNTSYSRDSRCTIGIRQRLGRRLPSRGRFRVDRISSRL